MIHRQRLEERRRISPRQRIDYLQQPKHAPGTTGAVKKQEPLPTVGPGDKSFTRISLEGVRQRREENCDPQNETKSDEKTFKSTLPPKSPIAMIHVGHSTLALGEVLGSGGYSRVYKVSNPQTKEEFALKIVDCKRQEKDSIVAELKGEVELLKSLRQEPRVIQLVESDTIGDQIFMVMELGSGDLAKIIRMNSKQPLDVEFVRYWGLEVLRCVAAVHGHEIVHSDLKPANLLVVHGALKLIDFGISNAMPDNTRSIHRVAAVGTVAYMAPETLRRRQKDDIFTVTCGSDMYSVGCILYELVYGVTPVAAALGATPDKRRRVEPYDVVKCRRVPFPEKARGCRVPESLIDLIKTMLNPDPGKRPEAQQAMGSAFFRGVCIDYGFLSGLLQRAVEHGQRLPTMKFTSQDVEDWSLAAWNMLKQMNGLDA